FSVISLRPWRSPATCRSPASERRASATIATATAISNTVSNPVVGLPRWAMGGHFKIGLGSRTKPGLLVCVFFLTFGTGTGRRSIILNHTVARKCVEIAQVSRDRSLASHLAEEKRDVWRRALIAESARPVRVH